MTKRVRNNDWLVFGFIAVGVVLVMVAGYCFVWWLIPKDEWIVFAEVYGALVATLFAGLAFSGLVLSVHLQRRELAEAREEWQRTAEVNLKALKASEAQIDVGQLSARLSAIAILIEVHDAEIHKTENTLKNPSNNLSGLETQEHQERLYAFHDGRIKLVHELSEAKDALTQKVYGEGIAVSPTLKGSRAGEAKSAKT